MQDLPPATPMDFSDVPPLRRPRIVGFVGWLCAGIGYMSFFLKGSQLPSYFSDMKWLNPNWVPPPFSRGQFAVAVSILLVEMLVSLMSVAAGLGALKLREWARRLLIYYGFAALVLTLLKAAWQVSMFDFMLDYQDAVTTQPFDRTLEGNRQFFALIISTLIQLMWPIIVITVATRRYVKDAFDAARLGDGASEGWESN